MQKNQPSLLMYERIPKMCCIQKFALPRLIHKPTKSAYDHKQNTKYM